MYFTTLDSLDLEQVIMQQTSREEDYKNKHELLQCKYNLDGSKRKNFIKFAQKFGYKDFDDLVHDIEILTYKEQKFFILMRRNAWYVFDKVKTSDLINEVTKEEAIRKMHRVIDKKVKNKSSNKNTIVI